MIDTLCGTERTIRSFWRPLHQMMIWQTLHGYGDIVAMLQLLFGIIVTREKCRRLTHLVY